MKFFTIECFKIYQELADKFHFGDFDSIVQGVAKITVLQETIELEVIKVIDGRGCLGYFYLDEMGFLKVLDQVDIFDEYEELPF